MIGVSILLLVLVPVVAAPVVGYWTRPISGLLLLLLLVPVADRRRRGWGAKLAIILTLLGGLVGIVTAGFAIAQVGK